MTVPEKHRNSDVSQTQTSDSDSEDVSKASEQKAIPPTAKNHQSPRFRAMAEFKPVECLCHAYKVNPCVPQIDRRDSLEHKKEGKKLRNSSWEWPGRQVFIQSGSSNMEEFDGIPRQNEKLLHSENLAFPNDHNEIMRDIGNIAQRIDIYYFDHGNSAYYRTTDIPPALATERCADKTDHAATRFWAEIFGTIHIGITFVTAFILQLLRFLLYSLVRPLTVGVIQMISDYFIKPLLTIVFNGIIQPFLILLYNIATSFRDLCEPIAQALGFFIQEFATVLRAIRLVEINHNNLPT